MSDPHSPRPATQHELDVAADALHLARYGEQIRREYPTFLHGEGSDMQDNCYEEANAVRLALAAFPAADPAASADADAAWEALWTDLEPGTQRDHARRHRPIIEAAIVAGTVWDEALGRRSFVTALDEGLADVAAGRTRPWADVRAAIRSAGTPPASREPLTALDLPDRVIVGANGAYWRDFGTHYSMAVVSEDNDPVEPVAIYVRDYMDPVLDRTAPEFDDPESPHALRATPPEPVGGRETVRESVVAAAVEWVEAHDALTLGNPTGPPDSDLLERYSEACNDLLAVVSQNRSALQASPPTGVSDGVALDDQCPERCLGVVGHAGPHQTSDYEPDTLGAVWAAAEAALPEGWSGPVLRRSYDFPGHWALMSEDDGDHFREGYGETPAAALRALAATFSEPPR